MKHHKYARGWRKENRMDVPVWYDLAGVVISYAICVALICIVFVELSK